MTPSTDGTPPLVKQKQPMEQEAFLLEPHSCEPQKATKLSVPAAVAEKYVPVTSPEMAPLTRGVALAQPMRGEGSGGEGDGGGGEAAAGTRIQVPVTELVEETRKRFGRPDGV